MASRPPGPETSKSVDDYDARLAEQCEKRELEMTFREALCNDKRLIWYSLGFSGTIIMEGYGLALITYLFSFPEFKQKFGELDPQTGQHELRYMWRVLLPLVAQFGSIIGILIASPITKHFGYKRTVLMMLVFSAAFVNLSFLAQSVPILLAGFLLQGIPWGVFQVLSPGYSSEIASVQLRPILTTWNNLCWVIGQLLASGIVKGFEQYQSEYSFRIPFALQWVFSVLLIIAVSFAPESPYWYLHWKHVERARAAIKKMVRKGSPERTEEKLALMRHTIHQENRKDEDITQGAWKRLCAMVQGTDRRRTEISCIAWLIQSLCGSSIIPWAPKLFESAGLLPSQALSINIALPAAGILGTLGSWWLMRKWGRRQIYFWGLVVMGILLAGCGFAAFASSSVAGWAAGAILIVYTAIYDLTIGPVCYSIVSEIPSIRRRTSTLSAARGTYLVAGLVNHFLTPKMLGSDAESWGVGPKTGFLYAGMCALGAMYTWFRIPETNGLSTRELDVLFQNKVKAKNFSIDKAAQLDALENKNLSGISHNSVHGSRSSEKV
ncbi:general substrate transporter [Apodospora peruviana]|uniref:General substrate transporter n=1 Tax=Apodospora peruviana TaxID=516989 RepID=A0AAE0LZV2_9PEZI|nr:general substrate transporter [Apodospora peruviana]